MPGRGAAVVGGRQLGPAACGFGPGQHMGKDCDCLIVLPM